MAAKDIYAPEEDIWLGSETTWLADERYKGERELDQPLAAVQMGPIYVNPEAPTVSPTPSPPVTMSSIPSAGCP